MLRQECSPEKNKAYNCVLHKTIRHSKSRFYHDKCHGYQCQTKKIMESNKTSLFLSPTCQQEIKKIVSSLPSKSSSGHNNISNVLLKEIIDQISQVLVEVFNKSMTQGEFPSIMKLAEVVPLYKGKEHYLETNQYGFRANHSCEHAIGQVVGTIVKALENKQ